MRLFLLSFSVVALTACQSCRKDPPPLPPSPVTTMDASPGEDASIAVSDAGRPVADAAPEAAAPAPLNPCKAALGAASAFCDGPGDVLMSVSAAPPAAKSRLTLIKSEPISQTRIAVRHVNGAKVKMKTVFLLTNNGLAGTFTLKKGVSGPSSNAQELERLAAERWASSSVQPAVQVAAGKSVRFDPSVEVGLAEGYATMGLYEYSFTQPHTLKVCFVGEREDFSACAGLQ